MVLLRIHQSHSSTSIFPAEIVMGNGNSRNSKHPRYIISPLTYTPPLKYSPSTSSGVPTQESHKTLKSAVGKVKGIVGLGKKDPTHSTKPRPQQPPKGGK